MIEIGRQIDPDHAELGRLRVAAEDAAGEKQAEPMARIDAAEWPGHVASFDGPGSIDELSRSVRDYLASDEPESPPWNSFSVGDNFFLKQDRL
jgi:hypothetical protein